MVISARAIRIFRGIMMVKLKHKCPQKPLILPAALHLDLNFKSYAFATHVYTELLCNKTICLTISVG